MTAKGMDRAASGGNGDSGPQSDALRVIFQGRPSKVLSRTPLRPKLTAAHVVEEDGERVLVATDSFTMVRLPVNPDAPLGPIPRPALRRLEKRASVAIPEPGVFEFDVDHGTVTIEADSEQHGLFSDKPAPTFDACGRRTARVRLDAQLLHNLAVALGTLGGIDGGVELEFPVDDELDALPVAIRVTGRLGDAEGLLMPIIMGPRNSPPGRSEAEPSEQESS